MLKLGIECAGVTLERNYKPETYVCLGCIKRELNLSTNNYWAIFGLMLIALSEVIVE